MKSFKHFLLSTVLVTGLCIQSPESNAALGISSGPAGVWLIVGGGAVTYLGYNAVSKGLNGNGYQYILFGLLILDKDSNEIELKELVAPIAAKLGITEVEMNSYNSELVSINLALSEMNSTLANANDKDSREVNEKAFNEFKESISNKSFTAVQKVLKTLTE